MLRFVSKVLGLKAKPSPTLELRDLASSLEKAGKNEEALAAIDEALATQGANGSLLVYRAKLLEKTGRRQDAISAFETALSMPQPKASWYAGLARLYELSGNQQKSIAALHAALRIDPDNSAIKKALRRHVKQEKISGAMLSGRPALQSNRILLEGRQDWSAQGVRDPALLTDSSGAPVRFGGKYRLFFNTRDQQLIQGGITTVGWAASDDLESWEVDEKPFFRDGDYTAAASAILTENGNIRLYYAFDTAGGFRFAETADGENWQINTSTLLAPADFGCRRIGLPFVFHHAGSWYLLCEGMRSGFSIFAARSKDGLIWHTVNAGEPIYRPTQGNWDSASQANPAIWPQANGFPWITYNGNSKAGTWDLGVLRSAPDGGIDGPWAGLALPLLTRSDLTEKTTRIEGARLVVKEEGGDLVYFTLPDSDSYAGGKIYSIRLDADDIAVIANAPASMGDSVPPPLRPTAADATVNIAPASVEAEEHFNDDLAKRYFGIWDAYPIQKLTRDIENRWIREALRPGQRVLLIGSGGGREIEALLDFKVEITAMDISQGMLDAGRERYAGHPITWVKGDAHLPPADLKNFDHVIGVGFVLCYLENPELALRNLRSTLRVGGQIHLTVVNSDHFSENNKRTGAIGNRVRTLYSVKSLRALLARSNYVVQSVRGLRYFVDGLPGDWNSKFASSSQNDELMTRFIELEADLVGRIDPSQAKELFITGRAI
ncbi:methyltransferase domain-containing protein [Lacibacterium aquatile]|uniref:Methyltransferase domain-containing protein n=1 Tax=Lacibacterium aquatile TaxID=1168082 RepID=A0ABW5DVQ0_9PROT